MIENGSNAWMQNIHIWEQNSLFSVSLPGAAEEQLVFVDPYNLDRPPTHREPLQPTWAQHVAW